MGRARGKDVLPVSGRQAKALALALARVFSWMVPQMQRETRQWAAFAERIPDEPLRADALRSLKRKRGNIAGALVFTILPDHRNPDLLRALFTHQVAADFLDNAHERHPTEANGYDLHLAVIEALCPSRPLSDYYASHPWSNDAGYLTALIEGCRRHCRSLPSFAVVEPLLTREAERARHSLCLNHLPDAAERDPALRELAAREFPAESELRWFELTAAMCGQLGLFLLLALAANPEIDEDQVQRTYDAYWPYIPMLATMLDSFVDRVEDGENGNHVYVDHYTDQSEATDRLANAIESAGESVLELPDGPKHGVILATMIAFYLSKDSARTPGMAANVERLMRAGGSLSRLLWPVLRGWRIANSQRGA